MKNKPMSFAPEMVRAILEGRKTQTRRPIEPQPPSYSRWHKGEMDSNGGLYFSYTVTYGDSLRSSENELAIKCPFKIGDRIWVREDWYFAGQSWDGSKPDIKKIYVEYAADGKTFKKEIPISEYKGIPENLAQRTFEPEFEYEKRRQDHIYKTRHEKRLAKEMPRWASRITLEITNVGIERVQDISEDDAKAEGFENDAVFNEEMDYTGLLAYDRFAFFWDEIYGKDSFFKNPWVWVYEFEVVK